MRERDETSTEPVLRRLTRGLYWRYLSLSFRFGKVPRSSVFNFFKPRAPWPGHNDTWDSLEEYAQWLPDHVHWKRDPLYGALDIFPDRGIIAAAMRDKGVFEDDCDGLAYFSAQNLLDLLPDPSHIYIVTLVLDPYTFEEKALFYAAHVICVFRHEEVWRVISNDTLYPNRFATFAEAVRDNPYCAAHPVLWLEVRTPDLKRVFAGRNPEDFRP
ncbi:MAG: hypothetical protein D6775_02795 [Caldilineae bacterium]|nr:MAG: hypothetical protein D6775_02795 [Caldilineae bacterium]